MLLKRPSEGRIGWVDQFNQIVGCHCKDKLERDATNTPVFGFVQSGNRLGPGEAFLDPLANDLAGSIPGCRVVRPSMAETRLVVFCATCGATFRSRKSATKFFVS